jgi:hypothetical protein
MRNVTIVLAIVIALALAPTRSFSFSILLDLADSPRDSIVNVIEVPSGGGTLTRVAVVMQVPAGEIDSLRSMVPFTVVFQLSWDCEGVGPEFQCVGQHGTVLNLDFPEPGDPAFIFENWTVCCMISCDCIASRWYEFEVTDVLPLGRMAIFEFVNVGFDPFDCSTQLFPSVSMYTQCWQPGCENGGVFTMMWDTVGAESTTWGRIKSLYAD